VNRRVDHPTAGVPSLAAELVVDARATLGEGPVWDAQEGCLWWVDIRAKRSIGRTRRPDLIRVCRSVR